MYCTLCFWYWHYECNRFCHLIAYPICDNLYSVFSVVKKIQLLLNCIPDNCVTWNYWVLIVFLKLHKSVICIKTYCCIKGQWYCVVNYKFLLRIAMFTVSFSVFKFLSDSNMGDTTGLSNTEARDLCKPPDQETKVSFLFSYINVSLTK